MQYKVKSQDLVDHTLWVTVWNAGKMKSKSFLGETCIAMGRASLHHHMVERWYELHDFVDTGVVMATPVGHTPCYYKYPSAESKETASQATPQQLVADKAESKEAMPEATLQQLVEDEQATPQQTIQNEQATSQQLVSDKDEIEPMPLLKITQREDESNSKEIPIRTAESMTFN